MPYSKFSIIFLLLCLVTISYQIEMFEWFSQDPPVYKSNLPFFVEKTEHFFSNGRNFTKFEIYLDSNCKAIFNFSSNLIENKILECENIYKNTFLKTIENLCPRQNIKIEFENSLINTLLLENLPNLNQRKLNNTNKAFKKVKRFAVEATLTVLALANFASGGTLFFLKSEIDNLKNNQTQLNLKLIEYNEMNKENLKIIFQSIDESKLDTIMLHYETIVNSKTAEFKQLILQKEKKETLNSGLFWHLFGKDIPFKDALISRIDTCSLEKTNFGLPILVIKTSKTIIDLSKSFYKIMPITYYETQKYNSLFTSYSYKGPQFFLFNKEKYCLTAIKNAWEIFNNEKEIIDLGQFKCTENLSFGSWKKNDGVLQQNEIIVQAKHNAGYTEIYCFGHNISISGTSFRQCPKQILIIHDLFSIEIENHNFKTETYLEKIIPNQKNYELIKFQNELFKIKQNQLYEGINNMSKVIESQIQIVNAMQKKSNNFNSFFDYIEKAANKIYNYISNFKIFEIVFLIPVFILIVIIIIIFCKIITRK